MKQIIRILLIAGGCYLFTDGLIHLMGLRLTSVQQTWPQEAVVFAGFMNKLFGSFAILTAGLCFIAQRNIQQNKSLIFFTAIWGFVHSVILLNLSTIGLTTVFHNTPSIYLWIPFYNYILYFEVVILMLYSISVAIWWFRSLPK